MALAPATVQNMTEHFSREPIAVFAAGPPQRLELAGGFDHARTADFSLHSVHGYWLWQQGGGPSIAIGTRFRIPRGGELEGQSPAASVFK
jgi:hypothetical protein